MKILVTGAAGLIGGELCARLTARGHMVTGLVHRETVVCGNDRQVVPGVRVVAGDVTQAGLGLEAVPDVDLVVHAAAVTAFDAAPDLYASVNVAGTRHVCGLGLPVLQVSTAYVCGTRDGRIAEGSVGAEFVNGYEASKAAAEAIVRSAGLPFAIARPSVVVGDWPGGVISRFENIYMIFKLIAEGRVRTLPGAVGASLDLVPIDHVCSGIVAMAEDFGAVEGQTLHLVGAEATPLTRIGEAIAAVPGLGQPHFVDPADFDPAGLPAVERRYHAAAAALYTNYLLRGPVFDVARSAAFGLVCPATDRGWLDRLIGYCVAQGFVRAKS